MTRKNAFTCPSLVKSWIAAAMMALPAMESASAQISWSVFAGAPGGTGYQDGVADEARFFNPEQAIRTAGGDVIVTDMDNHVIRKISSAGAVSTVAGIPGNAGHKDGASLTARFNRPRGIVINAAGEMFIADTGNHVIRKISTDGEVSTLAGSPGLSGSTNGTGAAARFANPRCVRLLPDGSLAVTSDFMIRKVTMEGVVTTIAGSSVSGSTNASGTSARFGTIADLVVDASGVMHCTETFNHTVRKITADGVVTTVAGVASQSGDIDGPAGTSRLQNPYGLYLEPDGSLLINTNRKLKRLSTAGELTTVAGSPSATMLHLDADGQGNLLFATRNTISAYNTVSQLLTVLAGRDNQGALDGPAHVAKFSEPDGITVDQNGTVYVAERFVHTIRKITPDGTVSTLAGLHAVSGNVNGAGSAARFNNPRGLCTDEQGNIYVSDINNNAIRKITPQGVVTTHSSVPGPTDVARDKRNNFYASNLSGRILYRDEELYYAWSDSVFIRSLVTISPIALAMSREDRLFMVDYSSSSIHQLWRNSNAVVLAGSGVSQGHGYADGIGNQARFNLPVGLAVDRDENLYVADTGNDMIRKITPAGLVSTIGANPTRGGLAAGIGRFSDFADPTSIAIGPDGAIYVANKLNHNIVKGVWIGPEIRISQWNPETQQYGTVDTPAAISLHPTMPGFASSVSLRIENSGVSTLTNLSLSLTGTHAGEYSITSAPTELAAGTQTTIVVQCTGSIAGLRSATLTITSNDVDEAVSTIQLSKQVLPAAPNGQYFWERFAGSFTEQGSTNGPRRNALFQANIGIAFAPTGEMLVVQSNHFSVRRIDRNGVAEHVAGVPDLSGAIDGDATRARFQSIKDVTVTRSGDVYVAEGNSSSRIRKITPAGVVSTEATLAGSSAQNLSLFYDESQQRLLIADDMVDVIHALSANGVVTVFAGISGTTGATNDSLTTSTFSNPRGLCMDLAGNLYVCDTANHMIRKISPQGAVTTYAGIAGQVGNDDGDRSVATFSSPRDIALTSDESLIITCPGSHTIRKISKTGAVTTIGGVAGSSGKVAGVGADARFMSPHSVAVAPDGRIHVATSNHIMQSTLQGPELAVVAAVGEPLPDLQSGIQFYSSYPGSMVRNFVCRNVGSAPFPSMVARVTGLHANRFSFVPPLANGVLAPGAAQAFGLKFQPSSASSGAVYLRFSETSLSPVIRAYAVTGTVIDALNFWNWENFGTLAQTESNAPTADPDRDGMVNLLEYAFRLQPRQADWAYLQPQGESGLPVVRLVEELGTRELRMEFIRRRASANPGISYIAEFSSNLSQDTTHGWKPATATPSVTPIDETWERVVIRDVGGDGAPSRYGRVRVVLSP